MAAATLTATEDEPKDSIRESAVRPGGHLGDPLLQVPSLHVFEQQQALIIVQSLTELDHFQKGLAAVVLGNWRAIWVLHHPAHGEMSKANASQNVFCPCDFLATTVSVMRIIDPV
jgi:hypothetical protein